MGLTNMTQNGEKRLSYSKVRDKEKRRRQTAGATMLETALILPLVLVIAFGLMYLSSAFNAKLSLKWAVGQAVRLAITRGDIRRVGMRIIPSLSDFTGLYAPRIHSFTFSEATDQAKTLLSYQVPYNDAIQFYDTRLFEPFQRDAHFDGNLNNSYPTFLYAIAYANETMRQSLGMSVKYPCDPDGSGPNDGPGCFMCQFLNPDTMDLTGYVSVADVVGRAQIIGPPIYKIALRCSYRPMSPFLQPISGLLRVFVPNQGNFLSRTMTVTKNYRIEINNHWEALQ